MRTRYFRLIFWLLLAAGCQPQPVAVPTATAVPSATPTPRVGVTLVTRQPPTPAVVQVSPTPLPTATPTPSPTPISYAVAEGDTLWVVAFKNYTTVDEILALNPALRPELLQIGQLITLPPPATPVFRADGRTPVPLQVDIVSLRLHSTPLGNAWLMGEVVNRTAEAVENIQVTVAIGSGDSTRQVTVWVVPGVIPPDGHAPFGMLVTGVSAESSITNASIAGGTVVTDLGNRRLDLTIADSDITVNDNLVQIRGSVRNDGAVPSGTVVLVATLYDASGAVSGFAQWLLQEPLAPAAVQSFALDVAPPGGTVVDYGLTVQGLGPTNP
jgi:LysM repeat protein